MVKQIIPSIPSDHAQFIQSQHLPRNARRSVVLALMLFLVVIATSVTTLLINLNGRLGQVHYIKFASYQRTLVESVIVDALTIARLPKDGTERIARSKRVESTISEMDRIQNGLLEGDSTLKLTKQKNQKIKDLTLISSGSFAQFHAEAREFFGVTPSVTIHSESIDQIVLTGETLQADLVALTDELERQDEKSFQAIRKIIASAVGGVVVSLIFGWFVLIRPRLKRLTEMYNALQTFRMAIDYSAEHMILTDPDGIIMYANSAVEHITGFSRDEIIGKKAGSSELWGGLMGKEFYEKMWRTIKHDRHVFSGEIKNRRKNGQHYTSQAIISPALDSKGNILFFIGVERELGHAGHQS